MMLVIYYLSDIAEGGKKKKKKKTWMYIRRKMKGKRVASLGRCLAAGYGIAHTCAYCYIGYLRFLERERSVRRSVFVVCQWITAAAAKLSSFLALFSISLSLSSRRGRNKKLLVVFLLLKKTKQYKTKTTESGGLVNGFRFVLFVCVRGWLSAFI